MSAPVPPEVPPEVPEEFAAAYREAYERALAEQSPTARHAELDHEDAYEDVPDDERWAHELPVRAVPPADGGAHRDPDPAPATADDVSREAQRLAAQARAKREARKRAEAEAAVSASEVPDRDGGPKLVWLLVVIAVLCLVLGAYLVGLAFVD